MANDERRTTNDERRAGSVERRARNDERTVTSSDRQADGWAGGATRVLLISTYELGRQPFGIASPAAWLRRDGFDVSVADLSRTRLDPELVRVAGLVAVFLPMHTATRLSLPVIDRVRALNPKAHICAYGLYAPPNADLLRERGAGSILGGEFEADLVALARRLAGEADAGLTPVASLTPERPAGLTASAPTPLFELSAFAKASARSRRSSLQIQPSSGGGRRGLAKALRATADESSGESAEASRRRNPRLHGSPEIARLSFIPPDRTGLPPLEQYAALEWPDGTRRVVGYTEASRGCKHVCRHCPVVPIYNGTFRIVAADVVLADIRAQVEQGARHITFGDPDFFNGIGHARHILERVAREVPGITYDVTIKIEHLLRHAADLPLLRDTGCAFVTSAVESVDDAVLARLLKGHTRRDFERAVELMRDASVPLVPTFVAFTPWTTLAGYADLLEVIEQLDLVDHVPPVQWAIRLLIPAGSHLLSLAEVRDLVGPFDPLALAYPWTHPDPKVDALQKKVAALAGRAAVSRLETFDAIQSALADVEGMERKAPLPPGAPSRPPRVPYLTEPWYCCAEPTDGQAALI
jgi:radical SAM superfamily enzyme YgiQ (UPF0313 family)